MEKNKKSSILKIVFSLITALYTMWFLLAIIIIYGTLTGLENNMNQAIAFIIYLIIMLIPYILIFSNIKNKKQDKKTSFKLIIIIEIIVLVCGIPWIMWPAIKDSRNQNPYSISQYNGIDKRYDK